LDKLVKMKKLIVFIIGITVVIGCKNESKKNAQPISDPQKEIGIDSDEKTLKQSDGLTLLKGEFLYMADAAVLQTHREIYGVVIDEKMHELNDLVAPFKKETTDMVPVEIRGKIIPKPENEEGWDYRVEIKEILNVSQPNPDGDDVIKLGN